MVVLVCSKVVGENKKTASVLFIKSKPRPIREYIEIESEIDACLTIDRDRSTRMMPMMMMIIRNTSI